MINPCLSYFVHLNANNDPIPGTMFAVGKQHGQATCKRKIAPVPATQASNENQCFQSNRLRYFYMVNKQTGQIVPNSMFSRVGKPKSMCSGQNQILEFIVTGTTN